MPHVPVTPEVMQAKTPALRAIGITQGVAHGVARE